MATLINDRKIITDIAAYLSQENGHTLDAEDISHIVEDEYDFGYCETCSFPEMGIMVYSKTDGRGSFYSVEIAEMLNWVALGKPDFVADLTDMDDVMAYVRSEIEDHPTVVKAHYDPLKGRYDSMFILDANGDGGTYYPVTITPTGEYGEIDTAIMNTINNRLLNDR